MSTTPHAEFSNSDAMALTWESLLVHSSSNAARPVRDLCSWGIALARQPAQTAHRVREAGRELARVAVGTSALAPSRRDRRFGDRAWSDNPAFRRTLQAYLALCAAAEQLLAGADLDPQARTRLELLVSNVADALAPSNSPLQPAALKELIDTGGGSLVRGAAALVSDLSSRPRVPTMVDTAPFEVGDNLAATPGDVVLRTPVLELIQYRPATDQVREVPLLLVPPTINKYYALDLAPGRSVVEYLVSQGQQVFVVSWRNPSAQFARWDLDTYAAAIIDALDAVREITSQPSAALWGTCSGGIITALTVAHLNAVGRGTEVSSLTLPVTVLAQTEAGTMGALFDSSTAAVAVRESARRGFLDGAALAEVFAWLRPNDLIWNYWVNNYLLGKRPPAFDILYWNADTTRMPAGLHRDFVSIAMNDTVRRPYETTVLGVAVSLGDISADAYVIGAAADHITPWTSCYRTVHLLGGKVEFVLSTSGHIAALVNPPGGKSSFRHLAAPPADAEEFQRSAELHEGSWWPHYAAWLSARTGELAPAPESAGRGHLTALEDAPGTYVFDA